MLFDSPPECVSQQLFAQSTHKELWTVQQTLLKPGNAVERVSVGKPAFGVDRFALFNCSPAAYRVKILKRKPYWVH